MTKKLPSRLDYIFWVTRRSLEPSIPQSIILEKKSKFNVTHLFHKEVASNEMICSSKAGHLHISHAYKQWAKDGPERAHLELIQKAMTFMEITTKEEQLGGEFNGFEVKIIDSTVEKFFVKGQNFTQLSDHYGVSCCLTITK